MSIIVESTETVVHIIFDRRERRNALNLDISEGVRAVLRDPRNRAKIIVLRSQHPGIFVAGADVAEMRERTIADNLARVNASLFQELEDHMAPTLAIVDGPALGGGCEIALACDFRIASSRSSWGLPEVTLGLVPSAGGLFRLERLVGRGNALDLILTGRKIDGSEAFHLGLVQRLTDADDIDAAMSSALSELESASRFAQSLAKLGIRTPVDHGRAIDAMAQALCVSDLDTQRRLDAFLKHRAKPISKMELGDR